MLFVVCLQGIANENKSEIPQDIHQTKTQSAANAEYSRGHTTGALVHGW